MEAKTGNFSHSSAAHNLYHFRLPITLPRKEWLDIVNGPISVKI